MRCLGFILFLTASTVWALPDPADRWLQEDAPYVYPVRQSDTQADIVKRFVKRPAMWAKVWCPAPDAATLPITAGDLLVRVRIDGRSWVQRARRADGTQPHAQELAKFVFEPPQPFAFYPQPQVHPVQRIEFDPGEWRIHEPAETLRGVVQEVWPVTETRPGVLFRVNQGAEQHLQVGTALTVIPAQTATDATTWMRAVTAATWPNYSYVMMLNSTMIPNVDDVVRSPAAWCDAVPTDPT